MAPGEARSADDVVRAYEEQFAFIEARGSRRSQWPAARLAAHWPGADDYVNASLTDFSAAGRQQGDPALAGRHVHCADDGCWGSEAFEPALETVLAIIERHKDKVEGIKLLLDAAYEWNCDAGYWTRDDVTGDDFSTTCRAVAGDGEKAIPRILLGIFDAIAPVANATSSRWPPATGIIPSPDGANRAAVAKNLPAPTQYYKAGVVFASLAQRPPGPFCHE